MADLAIAKQLGVKRDTVKKMRGIYGIPNTPKTKGSIEWHKSRDPGKKSSSVKKAWDNRRLKGTHKTGRIPKSAFKKGNDNGKTGKTHVELYGIEKARVISANISSRMKGVYSGNKNYFYGKPCTNKKNNHRGDYFDTPLQGKVWMRSSWEIEYAKYLNSKNFTWLYEERSFKLTDKTYKPDFHLINENEWHEVKGYMTELDKEKILEIKLLYGIDIKVIGLQEMKTLGLRIRPINK